MLAEALDEHYFSAVFVFIFLLFIFAAYFKCESQAVDISLISAVIFLFSLFTFKSDLNVFGLLKTSGIILSKEGKHPVVSKMEKKTQYSRLYGIWFVW